MKLSVISPTYNEVENVGPLIAALEVALCGLDYEIIIIDDDSPDLTWVRVEEIAKSNPRVVALHRQSDRGLGVSVMDGFRHATGEAVACIDADLQHDPSILRKMFDELEQGADLVVGTRYMPGGGTANWNLIRRFGSYMATKLAQKLLSLPLHDPMSGYFMLRRRDFLRVRNGINGKGFKILLEIAVRMKPLKLREVPYTFRGRAAGKSKLSGRVVIEYLRQLWSLSRFNR